MAISHLTSWPLPTLRRLLFRNQLRATTLEGHLKRTIYFVFGSGTIGAFQAELICNGYKQWLAQNPDKN